MQKLNLQLYRITTVGDLRTRYFNGSSPVDEQEVGIEPLYGDNRESFICELVDVYTSSNYHPGQVVVADVRYRQCKKCGHCHEIAYAYHFEALKGFSMLGLEGEVI